MKKHLIHVALITYFAVASCSKETELQKSVFIPDDDYPSLPAYSEWGYNTFGAYFDRELFIYNDYEVPVKIINTGGKTSFVLKGNKGTSAYYYYDPYYNTNMSICFDLYNFSPDSFSNLIILNDTIFDLTGPQCKVSVTIDTVRHEEQILNGYLQFKRAQMLIVDKNQIEVILSGYFEFQALLNEEPISVSLGRFDVGIGRDNFFKY